MSEQAVVKPAPWRRRVIAILAPLVIGVVLIAGWEFFVEWREIPDYVLPRPSLIAKKLVVDWPVLWPAWLVTLKTTFLALGLAILLGTAFAVVFSLSRLIELSFFPYVIVLQVTPLVAIAPLIMVWVEDARLVLLICAWIVAFFPILSGTLIGLRSTDRNLAEMFQLYGASRWQRLRWLLVPGALPYFLAGLKVSANLSLVGAIVAEFVVGAQGPGLASTIIESSYRLDIPRMFAALGLISFTGICLFFATHLLSYFLLHRWHDSARPQEA